MASVLRVSFMSIRETTNQEGPMKKKSPRAIPDFSRKRKAVPAVENPEAKPEVPAHAPTRPVKPQATSAKSGRRGQ
jgi:hypothetical protein